MCERKQEGYKIKLENKGVCYEKKGKLFNSCSKLVVK